MSLDVSIGAALFAGTISFLSPCVLPLVPPYLCFITGTSLEDLVDNKMKPKEERRQVMLAALMFVLGFSTVFVALGQVPLGLAAFCEPNSDARSSSSASPSTRSPPWPV